MVRHFLPQGENAEVDANTSYPPQGATHIFRPPLVGDMAYQNEVDMEYENDVIMLYEGS